MQTAAEYRQHAQECIDISKGKSVAERSYLLSIATQWLELADLTDVQEAFTATPEAIIAASTDNMQ